MCRRGLLLALALLASAVPAAEQASFIESRLPAGGNLTLTALVREPLASPARYELIVIPGSGCAGLAPIADRYFRGLLHARVIVLHKPFVDSREWPEPRCSRAFGNWDSLPAWRDAAFEAITAYSGKHPPDLPRLLLGISEGGELLPALAAQLPGISGMVLVGSSGLDPLDVALLQSERLGASRAWRTVQRASAGTAPDSKQVQGRSLRYWRALMNWPVFHPMLNSSLPVLQAWGTADDAVPQEAYQRFEAMMRRRGPVSSTYCALRLDGADHGLQQPGRDGLQDVWAVLETWARGGGWCAGSASLPQSIDAGPDVLPGAAVKPGAR